MAGTTKRTSDQVEVPTLLFLKNVDQHASESHFRSFLARKYLPSPTTVTFHRHRGGPYKGRKSGAAFVDFATAADARYALYALHGTQFNRRTLSVSYYQAEPPFNSRKLSRQEQCQDVQWPQHTHDAADHLLQGNTRIILQEPAFGTTIIHTFPPVQIPIAHIQQSQSIAPTTLQPHYTQYPCTPVNHFADIPHSTPLAATQEQAKSHHSILASLNLEMTIKPKCKSSTHALEEWLDTEQELTHLKILRSDQPTCFDFSLSDHINIQRFSQKESLGRKIAYLDLMVLEQALALDFASRFRTAADRKVLKKLLSRKKESLDAYCRESTLHTAARAVCEMRR